MYLAYPFSFLEGNNNSTAGKTAYGNYHNIAPASINYENCCFSSRLFIMRYAEAENMIMKVIGECESRLGYEIKADAVADWYFQFAGSLSDSL